MQIEIYNPAQGELLPPVKWNYSELKEQLTAALATYKGRIYTEETINEAKKDRAALNKLASAIDDRRREMKQRYLAPYQTFEEQAKELTALVKEQSNEIDAQVKAFDEARKAEKQERIKARYAEIMDKLADLVPYYKVHNARWLNVTYSMSTIDMEIAEKAESIREELASIDALGLPDDIAQQVRHTYLDKLDLAAALREKDRIERERQALADYEAAQKAARAAEKENPAEVPQAEPIEAQQPDQPALYTLDFRVQATAKQIGMLKAFMHDNGIKYGRVPREN